MERVRAYTIPIEATRGGILESRHVVVAAACGIDASSAYDSDPAALPDVWIRSTAKPFQLLPLLVHPAGTSLRTDRRDIAVCVSSHDGRAEHAERVRALLQRHGLSARDLRCGVHRPYFLQRLDARSDEHGMPYDELHNNCSGNHTAMLLWARACGVGESDYLTPGNAAQQRLHAVVAAASGAEPLLGIDNCGAPCYRLPLGALAHAYRHLVAPQLAEASMRALVSKQPELGQATALAQALQEIGSSMGEEPAWVSGEGTEATRLARAFSGNLILKHGAEGVLCVAHRRHQGAFALKVQDGNARALFPALLQLLQDCGWTQEAPSHLLAPLACPRLVGPPGHQVGELRVGAPAAVEPERDARSPAV